VRLALILWLILILFFVAIWSFFSVDPPPRRAPVETSEP
jgi:hypothetical protein